MHISEATREKVLGLVREYNYIPNQIAKGLQSSNSSTIGVVTYDISDPYVSKIVVSIESVCKANGISVLICNTSPEKAYELEDIRFLSSKMVDGIIFLRSLSPKNEEWVSHLKTPIIVVDREWSQDIPDVGMIGSNSIEAVYKATELLIHEGCERISYIGPSRDMRSGTRIEGYINALKDNGKPMDDRLVYQKGGFNPENGMDGVGNIFEEGLRGLCGFLKHGRFLNAGQRCGQGCLWQLPERGCCLSLPDCTPQEAARPGAAV